MDSADNIVPKLKVIGLGGAGCNAVDSMIESGAQGVEFISANTDAQALSLAKAARKIQLGRGITRGRGSGSNPETGLAAAEESIGEIAEAINGAEILFIAAGMGGGTGSGAIPAVAALAREKGMLCISVVTTPFEFEGEKKARIARDALGKLYTGCDCVIALPNENLSRAAGESATWKAACKLSDGILIETVRNITDLIMKPGLINLDFADIKSVMEGRGRCIIGVATESGDDRAKRAVDKALSNPLFDHESIGGAKGLLVNITGNEDNLGLFEVKRIMESVRDSVDTANIDFKFGTCFDPSLGDSLKVAIIATGIGGRADASSRESVSRESAPDSIREFLRGTASSGAAASGIASSGTTSRGAAAAGANSFGTASTGVSDFGSDFGKADAAGTLLGDDSLTSSALSEPSEDKKADDMDPWKFFGKPEFASAGKTASTPETKPASSSASAFGSASESKPASASAFGSAFAPEPKSNLSPLGPGDDKPDPPLPGGSGGGKKSMLSGLLDSIISGKEDTAFGHEDGTKLSFEPFDDEDDKVVFINGSLDRKKDDRQTDLVDMIKSMEENLDLPSFFKNAS
ncbi:MAG: cell division protein FtsZ [Rickettsiales bacterium]|jgi:cell division protein FtsZ|nr:cell division protein FtsZ [Rickettsiales bacterium]